MGEKGFVCHRRLTVKAKSVKELASFLGISQRHAFRLKKEGVFEYKDGYDLQACTQAYIKKLKAEKKRAKHECWLNSLSPDERASYDSFYDSILELDINDFFNAGATKSLGRNGSKLADNG